MPASSPADRARRLEREAAFHDVAFAEHGRSRAWKFYDAGRDAHDRYHELVAAAARPGAQVLEYGCGPGERAVALARSGARVHGIDISPVAIDLARARAAGEPPGAATAFSVMDAEALDLPSGSVDVVCGTSILHHLDLTRAYAEIARVLRPGGRAVFLEPLGHNPAINAYRRLTPRLRTADEHPLLLGDLAAAGAWFGRRSVEHFTLLSIAAVAAHGRPAFGDVARALRRADRRLFARVPALRRWSWTVVVVLTEPRPG
jgi:SAM-dependent methyltransferase